MASRKETGVVTNAVMSSTSGTLDSPVKQIQIEGLVSETRRANVVVWEIVLASEDVDVSIIMADLR